MVTALSLPAVVCAQPARARPAKIGILTPSQELFDLDVFLSGMRDAGFVAGQNLRTDLLSADGALDRLPGLASRLVNSGVDIIVAVTSPGTRAAMDATTTTPIVFCAVANPVLLGFVASFSRPGGNVTGVSNMGDEIILKRLELLRQAAPTATRILVTYHPDDPISVPQLGMLEVSAETTGSTYLQVAVRSLADLDAAFQQARKWGANGLLRIVGQGATTGIPAAEQALRDRLPGMFTSRAEVRAGGLMSYFAENRELFRRAAIPVSRILRGERPADLPVEQPVKFDFVVNQRTAKAFGIVLPDRILLLADEVIE